MVNDLTDQRFVDLSQIETKVAGVVKVRYEDISAPSLARSH